MKSLDAVAEPLAITMWDSSWLRRTYRGGGFEDWDRALADDAMLKTVVSFSTVDQQHVGNLNEAEFRAARLTDSQQDTPLAVQDFSLIGARG